MPLQPHDLARKQTQVKSHQEGNLRVLPGCEPLSDDGEGRKQGAFNLYSGPHISPYVLA